MRTYIIAEAGVNHNGDLELAKKLVKAGAAAGADAVKFQMFKADKLVTEAAAKADYQQMNDPGSSSQLEMLKKLELSAQAHQELMQYCKSLEVDFLSSPFDLESVDVLDKMGMKFFKIPSGEITNLPLLRKLGGKEVILSTGMSNIDEVKNAVEVLNKSGTPMDKITVLHCSSEYPALVEEVNLKAMLTIADVLGVKVGYSDHTLGIEIPIAAVSMGAVVIEKHFTLDKTMEGPDHKASLEPDELRAMILAIRKVEQALGNGIKEPSKSELKNKAIVRKSIVAARDIKVGEEFTDENITAKRPGDGLSPMRWDEVIGKSAKMDFKENQQIEL